MIERHGYSDIVLLAGHLGGQVEAAYQGRRVGGARIRVLRELEPLGTAGALTIARDILDPAFLMMNGDALFDINLRELERTARQRGALATLALRAVADAARYGRVTAEDGRVTAFLEKDATRPGAGVINGGVYIIKREALDLVDALPCSLETQVFPALIERGQIVGREFSGYFLDVGLPEALEQGRRELPRTRRRPAAFLDRDGVINHDSGYIYRLEDLRFIDGAPRAIRRLNDLGYYALVVSNQSGIARGFFGLDDVHRFNDELQRRLMLEGAHIDRFYISPYHPDGVVKEFALEHADRKPNPGMLLSAFEEWPIARERSFLIGDKESDIEAASRAGVRGAKFTGGDLAEFLDAVIADIGRG